MSDKHYFYVISWSNQFVTRVVCLNIRVNRVWLKAIYFTDYVFPVSTLSISLSCLGFQVSLAKIQFEFYSIKNLLHKL